jgi:hypothetical protein
MPRLPMSELDAAKLVLLKRLRIAECSNKRVSDKAADEDHVGEQRRENGVDDGS